MYCIERQKSVFYNNYKDFLPAETNEQVNINTFCQNDSRGMKKKKLKYDGTICLIVNSKSM